MKRGVRIFLAVVVGVIGIYIAFCEIASRYAANTIAHQRPFAWDKYALLEIRFTNATVVEVVSTINGAVAKASKGLVNQAALLDRTPADIVVYTSEVTVKGDMEKMVSDYRKDETNWLNLGACGFETCGYTGIFFARHSLGCAFQEMAEWTQLDYRESPDAIHLTRNPRHLECRSYKINPGLKRLAEDLKRQNQVRVDTDPVTSAFIDVAKIYLWSIDVPTGPNSTTGEFRFGSVFKYLPEKSILLVIETPKAHESAAKNLREKGFLENL
jgi:hypothetical protein